MMPMNKHTPDNAIEMIVIGTGIPKYSSKDDKRGYSVYAKIAAKIN